MVSFNLLKTRNANERVPVNKQLICHHSNSNYLVTTNCYVNGQCATVQDLNIATCTLFVMRVTFMGSTG